mmetsp:Transcript_94755/g.306415  ORF Transcript_94755/g.306415 Transcript_94755/m.306415 type:complete len:230 (+) Transcript_94755:128-817(+)
MGNNEDIATVAETRSASRALICCNIEPSLDLDDRRRNDLGVCCRCRVCVRARTSMARTMLVLAHILISRHTDPRLRGRERLATMAIVLFLPVQSILQPIHTLVQAVVCGGARGLDEPAPTFGEGIEPEFVGHLGRGHGVRQVLLVGENEKWHTHEAFLLLIHFIKLLLGFSDAESVDAVHDEDQGVALFVVRAPQHPNLVTAAYVENRKGDEHLHVLVLGSLDAQKGVR